MHFCLKCLREDDLKICSKCGLFALCSKCKLMHNIDCEMYLEETFGENLEEHMYKKIKQIVSNAPRLLKACGDDEGGFITLLFWSPCQLIESNAVCPFFEKDAAKYGNDGLQWLLDKHSNNTVFNMVVLYARGKKMITKAFLYDKEEKKLILY